MTDLSALFDSRSIAVVGASTDKTKAASLPLTYLRMHGFEGRVYPVNPSADTVDGLQAFPSLRELPEVPDLAVLTVPAAVAVATAEEAVDLGVRWLVVLSSGFAEAGEVDVQEKLAESLGGGTRLLGPNCEGFWDPSRALFVTLSSAVDRSEIACGSVAFVSQSGSIAGGAFTRALRRGVGCAFWLSVGNEADTGIAEALRYATTRPDVRVMAVYVEAPSDLAAIHDALTQVRTSGRHAVVLVGGRSSIGGDAVASHTGRSVAGPAVSDAVLRRSGALRAQDLSELALAVDVLDTVEPRPVEGLAVVSISGGAAVLLADECERRSVALATFAEPTVERLNELLHFGRPRNPVDVTGQVLSEPGLLMRCIEAALSDPAVDSLLLQFGNRGPRRVRQIADDLLRVRARVPGAFVLSFLGDLPDDETRRVLRAGGIIVADGPAEAVHAIAIVDAAARGVAGRALSPAGVDPAQLGHEPLPARPTWLELADRLEAHGVRLVDTTTLRTDDPSRLPDLDGRRWVVKPWRADLHHKTELGLVFDDVRSRTDLESAIRDAREVVPENGGVDLLLQPHVQGVEVIVGFVREGSPMPFGSLGLGGVQTELFDDRHVFLLPVDKDEIEERLRDSLVWPLLRGYRGAPACDVDALVALIASGARYFQDDPSLAELEFNPVIVGPWGAAAVDVLVRTATHA